MNRPPNAVPLRPAYSEVASSQSRSIQRALAAEAIFALTQEPPHKIIARAWPNDHLAGALTREATTQATTGTNADLLATLRFSFLSGLAPQSAAVKLFARAMKLDFSGVYTASIPYAATRPEGAWVGEGQPFPVKSGTIGTAIIGPVRKLMLGRAVTGELEFAATENASAIMGRLISEGTSKTLDGYVFDNVASSATRCAGLLYNVTPISATAGGTVASMVSDVKNLVAAIADAGGNPDDVIFIAGTPAALAVRFNAGPQFANYTIITCAQLPDTTIIAVAPEAIATVFSGLPTVEIAKETVYHFEDTSPLNISTTSVQGTVKSSWQSDELFLRLRLELAYGPLAPGVVQVVNSTTW